MEENMGLLVSIIVPIYNAEIFLERCINSILKQSYKNFELILVDDGSTDSTLSICQNFQSNDNRIIVIQKKNGGVSESRNEALKISKGDYVVFIDADDFVGEDYIKNLIPKNNEDFVYSGYKNVKNNIVTEEIAYKKININPFKCSKDFGFFWDKTNICFVWRACYKKDIIKKNNIKFDASINIGEDVIFNIEYLKYCNSVCVTENTDYFHCDNEKSLVHKYYDCREKVEEKISKLIENNLNRPNYRCRWFHWHIALDHYLLWYKKGIKDSKLRLRKCFRNQYFKETIKYIRKYGSLDEKIETYMMNIYLYKHKNIMLKFIKLLSK